MQQRLGKFHLPADHADHPLKVSGNVMGEPTSCLGKPETSKKSPLLTQSLQSEDTTSPQSGDLDITFLGASLRLSRSCSEPGRVGEPGGLPIQSSPTFSCEHPKARHSAVQSLRLNGWQQLFGWEYWALSKGQPCCR